MSKGLILITGVNGYIAAQCAKHFLDQGYSVRGTVRKLESAKRLVEEALKDYAESSRFEVVCVPDITVEGAFDEAVQGVTHIAHIASPVSLNFTDPAPILHAAVSGTTSVLASALSAGSQLKTVLLMSSIAAVKNLAPLPYTLTDADWNEWVTPIVDDLMGKGQEVPGPFIYLASKVAAERAFWRWKEEKKPGFEMVAVNPVFVIGPSLLPPSNPSEIPGTTRDIYTIFSGSALPAPIEFLPHVVDVRDVASITLSLLQLSSFPQGNPRYPVSSGRAIHPQAIADILRSEIPDARDRIKEGTPGEGYKERYEVDAEKMMRVDSSKAKELLGREWIAFEKTVVDTALSFGGLV